MNIFITHNNPIICASDHCDVHLRKMIVETGGHIVHGKRLTGGTIISMDTVVDIAINPF
jgi:hypothetical protein